MWDSKFQTEKQLLENQPGRAVVMRKREVVIHASIPADSNIRSIGNRYQGLKEYGARTVTVNPETKNKNLGT